MSRKRNRGNTEELGLSTNPSESFFSEMVTGEHSDFEQQLQESISRRQAEKSGVMVRDAEGQLSLLGCQVSSAGLEIPDGFTLENMTSLAEVLFQLETGVQLLIGDMLVAADRLGYGEISAIGEQFNRRGKTLSNWKSTCKAVTTSLRRELYEKYPDAPPLSISHYELIQGMKKADQRNWLGAALEHNWSVSALRTAIRDEQKEKQDTVEPTAFDRWTDDGIKRFRSALSQMKQQERQKLKEMLLEVFEEFD